MTNFEKQKEKNEGQGFKFQRPIEKPVLTIDEEKVIRDLINCIYAQRKHINVSMYENMVIDDFAKIYTLVPNQYVDVFKYQHRDELSKLAIRKMKRLGDYLNEIDDLIDEGEVRENDAYLEDGDTVRIGWKNVYFKQTR
ncbi:MAG: hypothetical protein WCP93_04495 [Candidatus Berkelbacteria bacterium]